MVTLKLPQQPEFVSDWDRKKNAVIRCPCLYMLYVKFGNNRFQTSFENVDDGRPGKL